MKKFYVFLPCVALTLALLTGCGQAQAPRCRGQPVRDSNRNPDHPDAAGGNGP